MEETKLLKLGAIMDYKSVLEMVDSYEISHNETPKEAVNTTVNVCSAVPHSLDQNYESETTNLKSEIKELKNFILEINAISPRDYKRNKMRSKSRDGTQRSSRSYERTPTSDKMQTDNPEYQKTEKFIENFKSDGDRRRDRSRDRSKDHRQKSRDKSLDRLRGLLKDEIEKVKSKEQGYHPKHYEDKPKPTKSDNPEKEPIRYQVWDKNYKKPRSKERTNYPSNYHTNRSRSRDKRPHKIYYKNSRNNSQSRNGSYSRGNSHNRYRSNSRGNSQNRYYRSSSGNGYYQYKRSHTPDVQNYHQAKVQFDKYHRAQSKDSYNKRYKNFSNIETDHDGNIKKLEINHLHYYKCSGPRCNLIHPITFHCNENTKNQ
jgi:hypothetical protein